MSFQEYLIEKFRKLATYKSLKEFVIFVLLVSITIIVYDEANARFRNKQIYELCLKTCEVKGDTVKCVKDFPIDIYLNFTNHSSNSSSFNISSG